MRAKKSWRQKLADSKGLPKVGRIDGKMTTKWGTGTMVVPAPMEVDEIMRQVPKGKLVTINEIRALLASKHSVTIACPITTGILPGLRHMQPRKPRQKGRCARRRIGERFAPAAN